MANQDQVFRDIREWMTAAGTHRCENKVLTNVDRQGKTRWDSFITFQCSCGECFKITLEALQVTKRPMRKYITLATDRVETARRLTVEPEVILLEMQNSGGWDQVDPKKAMALMLAGAFGPPGNEHERGLNEWMDGNPKQD
jgi:hypothetical protein